jgi:hypothetical protein
LFSLHGETAKTNQPIKISRNENKRKIRKTHRSKISKKDNSKTNFYRPNSMLKMLKFHPKNHLKMMLKNGCYKLMKNDAYKLTKIDPNLTLKISFIIATMGGSKNIKKRQFSISGPRTPLFIIFLNFLVFLQKRSIF